MLRRTLKALFASRLGCLLTGASRRQRGCRIINFHRVLTNDVPPDDYRRLCGHPTASEFDYLLEHLKKRFEFRSLPDLVDRLPEPNPDFAIGVTFDDGYADVRTVGAPILKKHGIPYTVFLTTGFIDQKRPWFSRMFVFAHAPQLRENSLWLPEGVAWRGGSASELRKRLSKYLNTFETREVHEILDEIERRNPWYSPPSDLDTLEGFMTWDEVRDLQRSPLVTYGAHTSTHLHMDNLNEALAEEELVDPKAQIEKETGRSCDLIAYPSGALPPERETLIKAAGYRAGFVMEEGVNDRYADVYRLYREYVSFDPTLAAFQLCGYSDLFRRQERQ